MWYKDGLAKDVMWCTLK